MKELDKTVTISYQSAEQARQNVDRNTLPEEDILVAAKGGGITFLGRLFAYGSQFALGILIGRSVGAEQFGLYNLGMTFVTITAVIASLGLGSSMMRYIPIASRQKDEASLWGTIQVGLGVPGLTGIVLTGLVLIFANFIAVRVFHEPRLAPVLRLASLTIPLLTLTDIARSITIGFKKVEYTVYAQDIGYYLVRIPLTAALLIVGLGIMGILSAGIVASVVMTLMLFYFVNVLFPLNRPLRMARREPGKLLRFSLPIYLGELVSQTGYALQTLVLGFLGLTTGVGIYSAVLRLSAVAGMFYSALNQTTGPIISDLFSQGKSAQLARFYQTVTKWAITFNLPIFLTFVLFGQPLLSIFGHEFSKGATALIILGLGSLCDAGTGTCGVMLNMTGHSRLAFFNSVFFLLTSLVFAAILIPRLEVEGAALAGALTVILYNVLRMMQVYVLVRIWPFNLSLLKPLIAGCVAAGATLAVSRWIASPVSISGAATGIPILWGTYSLVLIVLKFSKEDQLVINKLQARLNLIKFRG